MAAFDALMRETFTLCAVLALPALFVITAVGAAVAVLEAATQVQEQSLVLLPKLVAGGVLLALGGSAALRLCAHVFDDAVRAMPMLVRGA